MGENIPINLATSLTKNFWPVSSTGYILLPILFCPLDDAVFLLKCRASGYLSELRRATCSEESHSTFCSFFSAEFFEAASNLSLSTATGPDKVAYPMLKHLPRSGIDFLYILNLSWTSYSFPSIWKTSSIIPIHKMAKPLDFHTSFQPISLTSCVSKLFERIILSRLLFVLESNSILSPRQAGFYPGRSTLD